MPLAQQRANEIIKELYHRYRPRIKSYHGGSGLNDHLRAEDVLNRIDPRSVYYAYLSDIEEAGRNRLRATCPFHAGGNERTPSLSIQASTGLYYCFGACGAGGSIFQFVERIDHCSFPEALKIVNDLGGGK